MRKIRTARLTNGASGLIVLLVALTFSVAMAQTETDDDPVGYSYTRLQNIQPTKAAKDSGTTCLSFDAEFDRKLSKKPTAILDFENLHLIKGAITFLMDVVQISPKKYRLSVKTDPVACKALIDSGQPLSVTVQEGVGEDGLPVLPDQQAFKPVSQE